MPTGYTASIKDGITFQEYAMGCARAFGATITMRDSPRDTPIPDEFEPSNYHRESIEKSEVRLAEVKAMSVDECAVAAEKERQEKIKYHRGKIAEDKALEIKYRAMLEQAKSFVPPSEEHKEFAKFLVSQVEESIKFDCSSNYNKSELAKLDAEQDPEEWRAEQMAELGQSISYHFKEHAKEIERTNSRNKWVRQLRESLSL